MMWPCVIRLQLSGSDVTNLHIRITKMDATGGGHLTPVPVSGKAFVFCCTTSRTRMAQAAV